MESPCPIGFWLKLVDRLIDEQFAATLEEHGVTRRQWQLLNVLSTQPSTIDQLDAAVAPFLSAAAGDNPAETSAEHLAELVDSAWVDVGPAGYNLTERGLSAFERLEAVVANQRTQIAEGVSTDQYEQTVATLELMARNLGFES
ncbi:MAG: MarR family transcriptional regulator [Rhodoglobus sp.]